MSGSFTLGPIQTGSMRRLEVIAGSGNADHPVLGDIDGDGIADFEIAIANTGRNVRIASDFIL